MKLPSDFWTGLFATAAGAMVIWIVKLAINAIKAAVLKELKERIDEVENKTEVNKTANESLRKYAEENRERINFLIDSLINKNK